MEDIENMEIEYYLHLLSYKANKENNANREAVINML